MVYPIHVGGLFQRFVGQGGLLQTAVHLNQGASLGHHPVVVNHGRSFDTAALAGHQFEKQLAFFFPLRNFVANIHHLLHARKTHVVGFGHLHIGRHGGEHTAVHGKHVARAGSSDNKVVGHIDAVKGIEFHLFFVKPAFEVLKRYGRIQHFFVVVAFVFFGNARSDKNNLLGGEEGLAQKTGVGHHGRNNGGQVVQNFRHVDVEVVHHRRAGRRNIHAVGLRGQPTVGFARHNIGPDGHFRHRRKAQFIEGFDELFGGHVAEVGYKRGGNAGHHPFARRKPILNPAQIVAILLGIGRTNAHATSAINTGV